MKEIIIIFACLILNSCTNNEWNIAYNEIKDISQVLTNDNVDKNELKVYIDYPIFENTWANTIISSRFDNFIKNGKNNFKENQNGKKVHDFEKELHASFQEFSSSWTKSIYYEIFENFWWSHPTVSIKIFNFESKWKIISQDQVFNLSDEKKNKLEQLIIKKFKSQKINYFDDPIKRQSLFEKWFLNMNFYIDNDNIVFVFKQYQIAPYNSWIIKIIFWKNELKEFLKNDFFPEIKETEVTSNKNANLITENINPEKKYIALTFDDWPSKTLTPKLLEVLKNNDVKATFFVLWKNADYFNDIIKMQFDDWHEIWVHSRDHPRLPRLSEENLKKQLFNTREKIFEITWNYTNLMRPPYGLFNDKVKNTWWHTIILWDVDSNDWKYRNINKNIAQVLNTTKEWSIILMHDIHKESVESVDLMIKKLKKSWYEFVTVSNLLSIYQNNADLKNKVCTSWFICK